MVGGWREGGREERESVRREEWRSGGRNREKWREVGKNKNWKLEMG